jgi:RNA polymerase sigma factor, sigma-70 family
MSRSEQDKEKIFITVYEKYIDEVYQYIYLRTGLDKMLAEDITQDIFLDVYRGLWRFKGMCTERTWIFKITRNKLNDYYRMKYRQKFDLVDFDLEFGEKITDPGQDVEKMAEDLFEKQKVLECLDQLPEHYRLILFLKYMDDRSMKEIAKITGKTPKAIESILTRARDAFIRQYQRKQEENR